MNKFAELMHAARFIHAIRGDMPTDYRSSADLVNAADDAAWMVGANAADKIAFKYQFEDAWAEDAIKSYLTSKHPNLSTNFWLSLAVKYGAEFLLDQERENLDALASQHYNYQEYKLSHMDLVPLAIECLADGWLRSAIDDELCDGKDIDAIVSELTDPERTAEAESAYEAGIWRDWRDHVRTTAEEVRAEQAKGDQQ